MTNTHTYWLAYPSPRLLDLFAFLCFLFPLSFFLAHSHFLSPALFFFLSFLPSSLLLSFIHFSHFISHLCHFSFFNFFFFSFLLPSFYRTFSLLPPFILLHFSLPSLHLVHKHIYTYTSKPPQDGFLMPWFRSSIPNALSLLLGFPPPPHQHTSRGQVRSGPPSEIHSS